MHVVVLGAGAIGLTSAFYLAQRGAQVTLVDPGGAGAGASRCNAGWIVPTMSAPVPAPGVVWKSLRWMLQKDSPVYVRPTLDPAFVRFMFSMLKNCTPAAFADGLEHTLDLNLRTHSLFDELLRAGVAVPIQSSGVLMLFTDPASMEAHAAELQLAQSLGIGGYTEVTAHEARRRVPLLKGSVVGGLDTPGERFLDPSAYVDALVEACRDLGVAFRFGERVDGLTSDGADRVTSTHGESVVRGDAFVVAAGVWSRRLLESIGVKIPLQAGKGYGFDVPGPSLIGEQGLYLSDAKVAVTPLPSHTRLAGTMAFGGLDETIDPVRAGGIVTSVRDYLSGWPEVAAAPWTGLRPMTPDGLPIIGRIQPFQNLVVATGHAMLGITLSPVTGDAVADLVLNGTARPSLDRFSPDRFTRRRANQRRSTH